MKLYLSKKFYPYYAEYDRLGKSDTEEGRKFLEENKSNIDDEISQCLEFGWYRKMNLDSRFVHCPETEYNPPTPFL